jgi:hypothetical protein
MECPSCGSANQDSNRFCGNCGATLPQHCLACGYNNPIGNSYCGCVALLWLVRAPLERAVNKPAKPAADGRATTSDYSNVFTRIRDAVAAIVFPRASHSITTSALLIIEGGMVMPRAAAAFRLRNNSTSVTSCTGRSEGFSPLRIRPA